MRADAARPSSTVADASGGEIASTEWNRCWAERIVSRRITAAPPALCPPMVTRDGIAAEGRDVALHPLERREPVEDPSVVHRAVDPAEALEARARYEIATVTTPSRAKDWPPYHGLAGEPAMKPPP